MFNFYFYLYNVYFFLESRLSRKKGFHERYLSFVFACLLYNRADFRTSEESIAQEKIIAQKWDVAKA